MTRSLSATIQTQLTNHASGSPIYPAFLLYLGLDSGATYLWTGVGNLSYDGNTYQGVGALGSIGSVAEDSKLSDVRFSVKLSNIPAGALPDFVDEVTLNNPINRPFTMYLGFMDNDGQLLDAMTLTKGFIDGADITEIGGNDGQRLGNIELMLASESTRLGRRDFKRMTNQSQQDIFAGDKGLEFVGDVSLREITWGAKKIVVPDNRTPAGRGNDSRVRRQ